jgi:hypothetical protein
MEESSVPGRHALTIQLKPDAIGHAAVTLSDPSGQTYAGFGPRWHGAPVSPGQFDVHSVPAGTMSLPSDYSNVFGDTNYRTFTVPITEEQARAAHAEIGRVASEGPWYNMLRTDPRVCTTIVDRIMRAAGVDGGLYVPPQVNYEHLTDIADTLAQDPKARVTRQRRLPIPDSLRGIQRDYAYVGGGFDTPSERIGRHPPDRVPSFDDRFGSWAPLSADGAPAEPVEGSSTAVRPEDVRRLTRRTAPNPGGL